MTVGQAARVCLAAWCVLTSERQMADATGKMPLYERRDGALVFLPQDVRRVYIDVGAGDRTQFLGHVLASEDVAVIAFEPVHWLLRHQEVHPRVLLIPAAVAPMLAGGTAIFHMYEGSYGAGFSSLLAPSAAMGLIGPRALPRKVTVDVVALETLLERLPADISIPMLKVDAQGADLGAVLSAGLQIRRADRIQVECQDLPVGDSRLLYMWQATKAEIVTALRAAGFVLERCWENSPARSDVALAVLDGCFHPLRHMAAAAPLPETISPLALEGPLHTTERNAAKLVELWCCGTPFLQGGGLTSEDKVDGRETEHRIRRPAEAPAVRAVDCFDAQHTREHCCLAAYLEAIGYLASTPVNLELEEAWSYNRTLLYLVWQL
eukprot:gnl/TRDRNA2_/TRDRNA2_84064_c0_seq2.p1 gnl/TRDRNA2_/TRDRNA2_84064_c0~~gnl/TRDRNA2_/TRDRNA2_84064_c0_seq2.p1  ORF type:complete len:379 (-),score=70.39 gnl/TRDRNA2_/TRDRNA2_84064_c0_seq2:167-1303(-)